MRTAIQKRLTAFTDMFGVREPLMNAAMADVGTVELAAAVSEAGGLGVLAADFLGADELSVSIDRLRTLTDKPFAVNLRIPTPIQSVSCEAFDAALEALKSELGCVQSLPMPNFDAQFEVILAKDVPVLRVSFGGLREIYAERLKKAGILLIGTATSLREAKVQRSALADAIVVQGSEAGGPRLNFEDEDTEGVGLLSLIGPAARATSLPIIASGGIGTAAQMAAAFVAGAGAVELGTFFLRTEQCARANFYRKALEFARETDARPTRLLSGRLTRAIGCALLSTLQEAGIPPLPYPTQLERLRPVFLAAQKMGRIELMDLSCGQGVAAQVNTDACLAVQELCTQCRILLGGEPL